MWRARTQVHDGSGEDAHLERQRQVMHERPPPDREPSSLLCTFYVRRNIMIQSEGRKLEGEHTGNVITRANLQARERLRANGTSPHRIDSKVMESMDSMASMESMADVKIRPVDWLWDRRLAFGKLNIDQRMPGAGKSTLSIHIAAMASQGIPLHDSTTPSEPVTVLLMTGEDDSEDTIALG